MEECTTALVQEAYQIGREIQLRGRRKNINYFKEFFLYVSWIVFICSLEM